MAAWPFGYDELVILLCLTMQQIPPEHDSINVVTPETEPSRAATKPGKNLGRAEQKSTTIYLYYGPTQ